MTKKLIPLTAVALLLAACSSAVEVATEQLAESSDGVSNVAIDDGEVTVEFEDEEGGGSMVIGGGEVPADLPVPVPDGGTVTSSLVQEGSYAVSLWYPADRYDSLVAFYSDWVAGQPTENLQETQSSNPRSNGWFGDIGGAVFIINIVEGPGPEGEQVANLIVNWEE